MSTDKREQTRFVLLFTGRTGSTYLVEALSSHPQICVKGEKLGGYKAKPGKQIAWAENFLTAQNATKYRAVGFKTKFRDLADPGRFAVSLRYLSVRVIFLDRRNVIKHVVSYFNAERLHETTGNWNLYEERMRPRPLVLDPENFERYLRAVEQRRRDLALYVAHLGLTTVHLNYEDLLLEKDAALERLCEFLEVPPFPIRGECLKATSDDLRDAIANFDSIRARYVGTPYEEMFDEVLVPG